MCQSRVETLVLHPELDIWSYSASRDNCGISIRAEDTRCQIPRLLTHHISIATSCFAYQPATDLCIAWQRYKRTSRVPNTHQNASIMSLEVDDRASYAVMQHET